MKLIYTATGKPVSKGDAVTIDGHDLEIALMPKPHKPDSEGRVYLHVPGAGDGVSMTQYYVSVIGARWIEREDRPLRTRDDAYTEFRVDFLEASGRQTEPTPDPAQAWDDFIDTAIRQGRAPGYATEWSLATLPYNAPRHECPETRRVALTIADAYARDDSPDRHFWLYSERAAEEGGEPWRAIDGIDASTATGDDGRPVSFTLDFADGRSVADIAPGRVIYMQRTKTERATTA